MGTVIFKFMSDVAKLKMEFLIKLQQSDFIRAQAI